MRITRHTFMKCAAVLLMGLFITLFTQKDQSSNETNKDVDIMNSIVLELSDGTKRIIDKNDNEAIVNSKGIVQGQQNKGKIVYQNPKATKSKTNLVYNKLFVPYGEKIQIVLSDGSIVHLNSGSNIRYPVHFIEGMPREVYLDGEAYFDIAKNENSSFLVHTNDISTTVYGTEFNVSSYKNDDVSEVVLVEGSLGVFAKNRINTEENEVLLVPNKKALYNKEERQITTTTVNISKYIAWKDDILFFEEDRFENILRKLERHYNVSIQNNNSELNHFRFTGTFDIETIDQVLEIFSNYSSFEYVINEKSIKIN